MRFFEALLLIGNLITFLLLVMPRFRATRLPLYAGIVTVLILAAQVLVEGSRWQMVPAYALSGLLLLSSLLLLRLRPASHPTEVAGSRGWRVAAGFLAGLALLAVIFSSALPMVVPIFHFAKPGGPYAIGTLTYHWVDQNRADLGSETAKREIMAQIWYPAQASAGAHYAPYVQPGISFSTLAHDMHLPGFFLDHMKYVRTHAIEAAPMVKGDNQFPVLIFSPGAEGFRQHNTFEVEELVSHGYVVAAVDHPRAASEVLFPDGRRIEFDPRVIDVPGIIANGDYADRVLTYLGHDASFALTQVAALDKADPNHILTGRLDLGRAGMFGISLGGLVSSEACRFDARFRACLIQDVFVPREVLKAGVHQPTMWLSRDAASMRAEGWPKWEVDEHQLSMRAAFEGMPRDGYLVQIPGMFHVNYTDFPYIVSTPLERAFGLVGSINWHRGHAIINAYALAFFDHYLKQKQEGLLDGPSPRFPEVHFEARDH